MLKTRNITIVFFSKYIYIYIFKNCICIVDFTRVKFLKYTHGVINPFFFFTIQCIMIALIIGKYLFTTPSVIGYILLFSRESKTNFNESFFFYTF